MVASGFVENLREDIERFVAAAAQPALLDPGEEPLPLLTGQWEMSEWNGKLVIQAWDADRNLVRRILELKETKRHRLAFITERFPKSRGEMQIADLAAPESGDLQRRTSRLAFRDRLQFLLAREWPAWTVAEISSEPNLEASLSPSWTRALLRLGSTGMAVMAAPPETLNPAGIVPAALIWLDHLRHREKSLTIPGMLLYLPERTEQEASLRAALINPARVSLHLSTFDARDRCAPVDFADCGNLESTLPPARRPAAPNVQPPQFPALEHVDRVEQSDGSVVLQVRGLEFARWSNGKLSCGIGRKRRCTMETVEATALELLRVRTGDFPDRQHPLYAQHPEGWLESQVRANPQAVDPSLMPAPLYGQVPVFAGPDRGVIDLLGIDHTGRLAVIELKAAADHQLPFQAIDYWLRVRKHLAAGDFERLGYFPDRTIRRESPRIVLVAPALEFHSTSESLIGYLAAHIEITRVGLAADWRRELRVMFRLQGAERPQAT